MLNATDFEGAFAQVTDYWSPRIVGQVNDHYVKVAKLLGSLAWHKHAGQDELFLVLRGRLRIELDGGEEIAIGPGQFYVVPRDVRHNPVADEECWVALIEPVHTQHTGDVITDRTRSIEEQLR